MDQIAIGESPTFISREDLAKQFMDLAPCEISR